MKIKAKNSTLASLAKLEKEVKSKETKLYRIMNSLEKILDKMYEESNCFAYLEESMDNLKCDLKRFKQQ